MVSPKHRVLLYRRQAIFLALLVLGVLASLHTATSQVNRTHQVGVTTTGPAVTSVVVNNGSAITLTANATTTVNVSFTVTNANGCGDVFATGNVTTTLFRSGVSSTCAVGDPSSGNLNTLNCYVRSTSTHNCVVTSTVSANATSTFEVWYFANATDASSSYSSEGWQAFVIARDLNNATSATSSVSVELNTLLAISIGTSSLNYGTVAAGDNTSSTNQLAPVKNAGNSSTTLNINGTAMTSGANSISTSSQHYATGTFTYGGAEQALQSAATAVTGFLIPRPPLTTWATTTPLPSGYLSHPSVVYNGYVYSIGGEDAAFSRTSTVNFAPINATGSIGSWATTTALPEARDRHTSVVYNSYLYTIGGQAPTMTSSVLFAPINATGSLGSWSNTTALPTGTRYHASVVNNGYIYTIGGLNTGVVTSTVYFAPINSTGSIGSWTSTTALLSGSRSHASVVNNSYLYVIGGYDGSVATSTVAYAPINSTGSLGSWTSTTALPSAINLFPAVVNNGILYAIGGGSPITSTVLFALANASGSLSNWSRITAFPNGISDLPAVVNNGYLYAIGGTDGIEGTSTVLYTSIASRNTYWGLAVPGGTAKSTFTGTVTYTAVFSP